MSAFAVATSVDQISQRLNTMAESSLVMRMRFESTQAQRFLPSRKVVKVALWAAHYDVDLNRFWCEVTCQLPDPTEEQYSKVEDELNLEVRHWDTQSDQLKAQLLAAVNQWAEFVPPWATDSDQVACRQTGFGQWEVVDMTSTLPMMILAQVKMRLAAESIRNPNGWWLLQTTYGRLASTLTELVESAP